MARDYHHGDLPAALRASAVELIEERGPSGFSLREVARRAGVSHTAPAHHFGDAGGLLVSVATEGFALVADELARAKASAVGAREKFVACAHAYVTTALANPGHYGVMISDKVSKQDSPEFLETSGRAYDELLDTIRALRDEFNPNLDVDATATLSWSMVHGLVELAPILGHVAESTGAHEPEMSALIEQLANTLIDGIRSR